MVAERKGPPCPIHIAFRDYTESLKFSFYLFGNNLCVNPPCCREADPLILKVTLIATRFFSAEESSDTKTAFGHRQLSGKWVFPLQNTVELVVKRQDCVGNSLENTLVVTKTTTLVSMVVEKMLETPLESSTHRRWRKTKCPGYKSIRSSVDNSRNVFPSNYFFFCCPINLHFHTLNEDGRLMLSLESQTVSAFPSGLSKIQRWAAHTTGEQSLPSPMVWNADILPSVFHIKRR